ncbi:hypothetical protein Aduo_000439 [Ancylostoma duodenale]
MTEVNPMPAVIMALTTTWAIWVTTTWPLRFTSTWPLAVPVSTSDDHFYPVMGFKPLSTEETVGFISDGSESE